MEKTPRFIIFDTQNIQEILFLSLGVNLSRTLHLPPFSGSFEVIWVLSNICLGQVLQRGSDPVMQTLYPQLPRPRCCILSLLCSIFLQPASCSWIYIVYLKGTSVLDLQDTSQLQEKEPSSIKEQLQNAYRRP